MNLLLSFKTNIDPKPYSKYMFISNVFVDEDTH